LLDTGQHLQIKGNVEFDRYTLHFYDYLNFFPSIVGGIVGARIDMPAVEILDSLGRAADRDAYAHDERYMTLSLFVRGGARYLTRSERSANKFLRNPKELFDEWTMGWSSKRRHRSTVREIIQNWTIRKVQLPGPVHAGLRSHRAP
jgi:hypothetical protein